ncbi:MAG: hypothetical protein ABGY24_07120, partial [bacterium]
NRAHLFTPSAASGRERSCFALDTAGFVDAAVCRSDDEDSRRARDVARLVVTGDLQQWLRGALGGPVN